MLDYHEKRGFPRMELDSPARFRVAGEAAQQGAIMKNLSGGGALMWIGNGDVGAGTVLTVEVTAPHPLTPPMRAEVRVLRCTPVEDAEGQFAIGCMMQRVLD